MSDNLKDKSGKTPDTEEELIPVGEGVADLQTETPDPDTGDDEDSHLSDDSSDDTDGDDDGDGEEDDSNATDEERARIRAQRRKRKRNKKANLHRDRLELNFLRERNLDLERRIDQQSKDFDSRISNGEKVQMEGQLSYLDQQIALADQIISSAIESDQPGRGQDIVKAQNARNELVKARDSLISGARRGTQTRQAPPPTEQQPTATAPLSEVQRRRAGEWFNANRWYDPHGRNPQSQKVIAIDQSLSQEGYDSATEEYWDEFESRVEKALPELFESDDPPPPPPRGKPRMNGNPPGPNSGNRNSGGRKASGGPVFSIGGQERQLKKGEVYITPERRKALEDAGMWDDPKLRNRFLKRYADYDAGRG